MYLLFVIFIFLFLVQILLGLFATRTKKSLKKKYSYYLGEQIEFNKILEKYKEDMPRLKIIATDEITDVCIAEENLLVINKKSIYAKDLYSNLYLLFQLKLTQKSLKEIRKIYSYQMVAFFAQFVSIILFLILPEISITIILIGYTCLALNIFISIYGVYSYNLILKEILSEAKSLLKLDKVEQARAENLANEIKYEVLTYPLEIPWRLSRFWNI